MSMGCLLTCVLSMQTFNEYPVIPIGSARMDRIDAVLKDIHAQAREAIARKRGSVKHLQLLIVVLPDVKGFYGRHKFWYWDDTIFTKSVFWCVLCVNSGRIKTICETELGIVSQCCLPRNISRCNKQYLENVAQKINVKVLFFPPFSFSKWYPHFFLFCFI